jgi:hypothetical protein
MHQAEGNARAPPASRGHPAFAIGMHHGESKPALNGSETQRYEGPGTFHGQPS